MKALIAYESETGHTRQVAEAIAAAVQKFQGRAVVKPVSEVKIADVIEADVLFVGTWVKGLFFFNVKPVGAEDWAPQLPSLGGKPVGVFCTYLLNPRKSLQTLAAVVEARGAHVQGMHAFRQNQTAGAEEFVRGVLEASRIPVP